MAMTAEIKDFLKLVPTVKDSPLHSISLSYDEEADVLYINFKKPSLATDSEMTEDDIILRYEGKDIVGVTVLNAGKRAKEVK